MIRKYCLEVVVATIGQDTKIGGAWKACLKG